jgi:hypothetical protein
MSIGKSLARILAPIAVVGALAFGNVNEVMAKPIHPYVSLDFDAYSHFADPSMTGNFLSIPEYVRDVPKHPDDDYALDSNVAPIKDTSPSYLIPLDKPPFELRALVGIEKNGFDLSLGPSMLIGSPEVPYSIDFEGYHVGRNYTNYPGTDIRGYDAALTYYSVQGLSRKFSFGFFSRLSYKVLEICTPKMYSPLSLNLFAEYSINPMTSTLKIENGWDRYDSYEIKDTYHLDTKFIRQYAKAGIKVKFLPAHPVPFIMTLNLFAGKEFYNVISSELPFELSSSDNFVIGFGTGFEISSSNRR